MARPGASSHLAQNYALLPLIGEPVLVVNPLMAINAADIWVKDLYPSSDLPLESDMVLNLEAGLFMPGVGSLQIERSFVVTPAGNRPLPPQTRGLSVQP